MYMTGGSENVKELISPRKEMDPGVIFDNIIVYLD